MSKIPFNQRLGRAISRNTPTILTGISIAGLMSTVFMAVEATPRALQIIEDERRERRDDDIPKTDIIKLTWKCYIPTIILGTLTATCIIRTNSINLKRNAALAGLYSITETTLKEYQKKVVETIGANKERVIRDEVTKEQMLKNPVSKRNITDTGKGETLCYDEMSGRYFKSDIESIRRIENQINQELLHAMYISLNDIYYELGLRTIKVGDDIGWYVEHGLVEFDFSSQLTEEGLPCLVIDYVTAPRFRYLKPGE